MPSWQAPLPLGPLPRPRRPSSVSPWAAAAGARSPHRPGRPRKQARARAAAAPAGASPLWGACTLRRSLRLPRARALRTAVARGIAAGTRRRHPPPPCTRSHRPDSSRRRFGRAHTVRRRHPRGCASHRACATAAGTSANGTAAAWRPGTRPRACTAARTGRRARSASGPRRRASRAPSTRPVAARRPSHRQAARPVAAAPSDAALRGPCRRARAPTFRWPARASRRARAVDARRTRRDSSGRATL